MKHQKVGKKTQSKEQSVSINNTFICSKDDFHECLIESELGEFKGYSVLKKAHIYHGTACTVSDIMVLSRGNFFAEQSVAKMYADRQQKVKGCGATYGFVFKKSATFLRMDLCSNVKLLAALAKKAKKIDVLEAIQSSFRCDESEAVELPLRYSKTSQVDLLVANFVLQLGFAGFATKHQRAISLASYMRILRRGKTPSRDAFFHAEIFLGEPSKYLTVAKHK